MKACFKVKVELNASAWYHAVTVYGNYMFS